MQIDLYDFATLQKVSTLIDTKDHKSLPMIDSYTFNSKENMILLACESDQIFRHSFVADYYLYDIASKKLTKLFDFKIQEPTFSPDGNQIAYAKDNNLLFIIFKQKHPNKLQLTARKIRSSMVLQTGFMRKNLLS